MIPRLITQEFFKLLKEYPVVTLLGPRQSGKTTLVQSCLPDFNYVSLENPETRLIAIEDPKAFLARYPSPVIFDEIQRTPELLSYIQGIVDAKKQNGLFVLTGSHQLELRAAITQSLAGRTALLYLLPLSIAELQRADKHLATVEQTLFHGFLPRVFDQAQRPHTAYSNYYQTYVERDVRQLIQLKDANLFEKFIKLLAGRIGQVINMQSLANDVGIDSKTVKHWLSILEASFVVFKLPPYFENIGKRAIKSPKYYFTDTGLLCFLLDIEKPDQITRDPLVGQLFENLVILEAFKARFNQGLSPNLYFFRDHHGNEIDLLHKVGRELYGFEIKSAATFHRSFKKGFERFPAVLARRYIVYNGENIEFSDGIQAIAYAETGQVI